MRRLKRTVYGIADRAIQTMLRRLPVTPTTEMLALRWGYRFQPGPDVIRLRSGPLIYTNQVDHLQLLVRYQGTFEPHCLQVMREHLPTDGTLLDIGANIGLFSIEAATRGATVVAVEAVPRHVETIQRSIEVNSFTKIDLISCAVGDASGIVTMRLPSGGNHGMFTLGEVDSDIAIEVPMRTIDDIVGGRRIDFVKMDIEGSEFHALLGARETILRSRPPILIELNEKALRSCGSSTADVKALLHSFGYTGKLISTGQIISMSDSHDCDECLFVNY